MSRHRRRESRFGLVLERDLEVMCPTCGQPAGVRCRAIGSHVERVRLADAVADIIDAEAKRHDRP